MNFIKWFIDRHGVIFGGSMIAIAFVTFCLLTYVTKGLILIFVVMGVFAFIIWELIEYFNKPK